MDGVKHVEREPRRVTGTVFVDGETKTVPVDIVIERIYYEDGRKAVNIHAPRLEAWGLGSGKNESVKIEAPPLEATAEQPPESGEQEG